LFTPLVKILQTLYEDEKYEITDRKYDVSSAQKQNGIQNLGLLHLGLVRFIKIMFANRLDLPKKF
jgi:hypothetical protein